MKPMTQNAYFLLWKTHLTNFANELSLNTRITASVTRELETEPYHHYSQRMLEGPHSRHIEVQIKVASDSDDQEIEFTLAPACIFCAYTLIPIPLKSSNRAVTEFLNGISSFDWQPKEYQIVNHLEGFPPQFVVSTNFPENIFWPEWETSNQLKTGSVAELLLFSMKKRDELQNLVTKFPCDPWEVIRLLKDKEDGKKIPLDIFGQLENLAITLGSNPIEVLRNM